MSVFSEPEQTTVYEGPRGEEFRKYLQTLLSLTSLDQKHYNSLLDEDGMRKFSAAFTHPSASDPSIPWSNYEWAEFKGDSVANHAVVEYIDLRFPQFDGDSDAVRVGTRIKINMVSKATFSELARGLGFWRFISASSETRLTKMRPLLEDTFEAFIGVFSNLVDRKCRRRDSRGRVQLGAGFQFSFELIREVLDTVSICGGLPNSDGVQTGKLQYDELVDWITQLKELFDLRETQNKLGKIKYVCRRSSPNSNGMTVCTATVALSSAAFCFASATAALQADAKQKAAKEAVLQLRCKGITRPLPKAYAKYCAKGQWEYE